MGDRKVTGWLEVTLMTLLVAAVTLIAASTPLGQRVHPDDSAHLEQAETRAMLARLRTSHLDALSALLPTVPWRNVLSHGVSALTAATVATVPDTERPGNADLRQILLPAPASPRPTSEPEIWLGEARPNLWLLNPAETCNGTCRRTFVIPTPAEASPGP